MSRRKKSQARRNRLQFIDPATGLPCSKYRAKIQKRAGMPMVAAPDDDATAEAPDNICNALYGKEPGDGVVEITNPDKQ